MGWTASHNRLRRVKVPSNTPRLLPVMQDNTVGGGVRLGIQQSRYNVVRPRSSFGQSLLIRTRQVDCHSIKRSPSIVVADVLPFATLRVHYNQMHILYRTTAAIARSAASFT